MKLSFSDKVFNVFNYILMSLCLLIVLYPLYFIVIASISDPNAINAGDVWLLPKGITFEGYKRVFANKEIISGYLNTIYYTCLGTVIALACTVSCAYSLSRRDYVCKNFITILFTITMFFSGGLIPLYLVVKAVGFLDTVWALVIPGAASVYNIIITRTYFQSTIPYELQEAAEIDGCSIFGQFFKIVLPLSVPILVVIGLYNIVSFWNSYFGAMIYLNDRGKYPLQLIIREILIKQENLTSMMTSGEGAESAAAQAQIAELLKYAVIIVSAGPLLVIYPFLQKYFLKGVMIGSIKG